MKRPQREFYSIGEVCELFGLKPHVLRYWETQFAALNPPKNRAGNRVYRQRDMELIALIQHLVRDERYTIEGARALIEVEDECGGMPEERLEDLFSPLVQRGENRSGFGLGLAIARQAVEAHGGRIQVESALGVGTTMRIFLPAQTEDLQLSVPDLVTRS